MNEKKTPRIRFKGFTDDWEQRKDGELDVDNLGKFIRRSEDKSTYKHVHSGDLIFNMMRAWQGAIGVAKTEGMISPAYISAIPSEDIYPPFMNYLLRRKNVINQINNLSYGVTDFRKRLYWNSFVQVNCKLPSVEEQRNITDVFEKIDNLITLHQRKYEKLQIIKKSMLENCFPKNGEKVPKIRFSGFTGDWEQRKLSEVTTEFKSGEGIKADEIEENGTYPVYGGNGLRGYTERYNHDGEYALIGRQGALCGNMNYSVGKAYFTEHAVAVKANESNDTRFLYYLLDRMDLGRYSDQSAQPGLAVNKLVVLHTYVPRKQEQEAIGVYFKSLDHLITLHQSELEKLQKIKKSMLERMFV